MGSFRTVIFVKANDNVLTNFSFRKKKMLILFVELM